MKEICIREQTIDFYGLENNKREDLLALGFKFTFIDEAFVGKCIAQDFDEDLTFNIDKYNKRIQKLNNRNKIDELKQKLKDTDYIALKAFEGSISEAEFEPVKKQREEWRKEVDALLKQI